MKKRYSTPEMEVEAFNIFTVFTDSSTGGGGIDQGGEEVGDDSGAKAPAAFMPTIPPGLIKSKKAGEQSPAFSFAVGWGDAAKTLRLDYSCALRTQMLIYYE